MNTALEFFVLLSPFYLYALVYLTLKWRPKRVLFLLAFPVFYYIFLGPK